MTTCSECQYESVQTDHKRGWHIRLCPRHAAVDELEREAKGWEKNAREMAGFQAEACLKMAELVRALEQSLRLIEDHGIRPNGVSHAGIEEVDVWAAAVTDEIRQALARVRPNSPTTQLPLTSEL